VKNTTFEERSAESRADYGPAEISEISGSLHFGTLLLSKLFSRYLGKEENLKIAAALKGCDVTGLYELAKRGEVRLENILMLGLNCGGSMNETASQKCQESRGLFSTFCQRRFRKQVRPGQGCCLS